MPRAVPWLSHNNELDTMTTTTTPPFPPKKKMSENNASDSDTNISKTVLYCHGIWIFRLLLLSTLPLPSNSSLVLLLSPVTPSVCVFVGFFPSACLPILQTFCFTETDLPEVTQCEWQEVQIQLLTNKALSLIPAVWTRTQTTTTTWRSQQRACATSQPTSLRTATSCRRTLRKPCSTVWTRTAASESVRRWKSCCTLVDVSGCWCCTWWCYCCCCFFCSPRKFWMPKLFVAHVCHIF